MLAKLPLPRPLPALALVLSLAALAAALVGASQTFAQTHRAGCSASGAHGARTVRHGHACTTHKGHARRNGKHAHGKGEGRSRAHVPLARCEDGGAPTLNGEGFFTCEGGSEPECENGGQPTLSSDGKHLICPAPGETEQGTEAECEELEGEEEGACGGEANAQACEAARARCEAHS